jgi:hypothetical protein
MGGCEAELKMAAVAYAVLSLLFGVVAFALLLPQGLLTALLMAPVAGSFAAVVVVALLLINAERGRLNAERGRREQRERFPDGVVWG